MSLMKSARARRWFGAAMAGGLLASALIVHAAPVSFLRLRDVAIPVYDTNTHAVTAIVRIGEVFPDHDRRGFFKIGVLPIVVAQEVDIEFRAEASQGPFLRMLHGQLPGLNSRRPIVFRNVRFRIGEGRAPVLTVGEMRLDSGGALFRCRALSYVSQTGVLRLPKARLEVTAAGDLGLRWDPAHYVSLLRSSGSDDTLPTQGDASP